MANVSSGKGKRGAERPRDKDLVTAASAEQSDGTRTVAAYLSDMTGQLESMARAANLELLAYLLAMARAEAEAIARTPRGADRSR